MNVLLEMKQNLQTWRRDLLDVKRQLASSSTHRPNSSKAGFRIDQLRDFLGRWALESGVEVTTSPGFVTGIPEIDSTSARLSTILARVVGALRYVPFRSPQTYGVAVHVAFGLALKFENLPGIGDIERSFHTEDSDPRYGLAGTIRTDATLRNIQGDIVAIYDVKTGNARMSSRRADELRESTGANPNTPVFELNVVRGVSRKSYATNDFMVSPCVFAFRHM